MKRLPLLMMTALLVGCEAAQPPAGSTNGPSPDLPPVAASRQIAPEPASRVQGTEPQPSADARKPPKTGRWLRAERKGVRPPRPFPQPPIRLTVSAVAFSPDGKFMLTGYGVSRWPEKVGKRFSPLRLWDVASGQELAGFEEVTSSVVGVCFLPDSRHAVVGTRDGVISIWDMDLEQLKMVRHFRASPSRLDGLALSPDAKRVLASGTEQSNKVNDGGYARLFDLKTGKLLWSHDDLPHWGTSRLTFTPDGKHAVDGWAKGIFGPWDKTTGLLKGSDEWKDGFQAFSPDGKMVLGVSEGCLVLWELATGREIRKFERPHSPRPGCRSKVSVKQAHFVPGGKNIVSGDSDLSLRNWDVATGKQVQVVRIPDPEIERYADNEYIQAGGRLYEEARFFFSADGRYGLSIIGSDEYGPKGGELFHCRLILWDTTNFKLLGPAVYKWLVRPLDPSIR